VERGDGGVKKEKLFYLFQKSIQIFSLAYSTGKYSLKFRCNSSVLWSLICRILLAFTCRVQSLHPSKLVRGRVGHPESKLMVGINCKNKTVQTFQNDPLENFANRWGDNLKDWIGVILARLGNRNHGVVLQYHRKIT
jgi:hypothetical protein